MDAVDVQVRKVLAGGATNLLPAVVSAVGTLPELTWQRGFIDAVKAVAHSIEENERIEVIATLRGEVLGGAVLVIDDDMHVGPCLTVQWAYIKPEYRGAGSGVYRQVLGVAKRLKTAVLAYSHRTADGVYQIRYRRVQHG